MPPLRWDVTRQWKEAWPGSSGGVLIASRIELDDRPAGFDQSLAETETLIREQFAGLEREQIRQSGHLAAYHRYYRSFGQNYHVQHQIESIAKKGRTIPRRNVLVEIGFKWELRNGLLTGVHDCASIRSQVLLDVAAEPVTYQQYNDNEIAVKQNDMYYRDGESVLSSIIAGPSNHGRVTAATTDFLVTVYGVPGVPAPAVEQHLHDIWGDIERYSPGAELIELSTRSA